MASKKVKETKTATPDANKTGQINFLFGKQNYMWLGIGFAIVVIGFILMYGTEGDIYDLIRTTLAPITVLIGFGVAGISIFKSSKKENESD